MLVGDGTGLGAAVGRLTVGGTSDGCCAIVADGSNTTAVGTGAAGTSDGAIGVCAPPAHALNSSNNTSGAPRRTRN